MSEFVSGVVPALKNQIGLLTAEVNRLKSENSRLKADELQHKRKIKELETELSAFHAERSVSG